MYAKSDFIYPSAIFSGENLLRGEYTPLNLAREPINISLSLQGEASIKTEIENPRVISSTRETINNLLNQENLSGPASLSFHVTEASSSGQFSLNLGPGIGLAGVSLGLNINSGSTFEHTRKSAQFTQKYYSISTDRPKYESGFFENTVTASDVSNATNGYMPVYVSSVTYGRRGIFELTTEKDTASLEQELNVNYKNGAFSVGTEINDTVTETLESSDFKLYLLGGDGNTAVKAINSYDDFLYHIEEGGTFSPDNRGEIIGFELRYLHDDSLAKIVINESYTVIQKVPRTKKITYYLDYVQASTDEISEKVIVTDMSISTNTDGTPLWNNYRNGRTSSHYGDLYLGKNTKYSVDSLLNHLYTNSKEDSFSYSPKTFSYSDIENDTIEFSSNIKGSFGHGKGFSLRTKTFNIIGNQVFPIKDIEDGNMLIFTVSDTTSPTYIFTIAISTKIEYEDINEPQNE